MSATPGASVVTCLSCHAKNRVPASAPGRARCAKCHTDLPWLVSADDTTFDDAVVGASVPVLVDIWAPWCGPCRQVTPVVERLAHEHAGRLKVVKVNADESPQVSQRHQVTGIPTLLLYRAGTEVARSVGARPPDQLERWLAGHLDRIHT